jgi:hypothetical protein
MIQRRRSFFREKTVTFGRLGMFGCHEPDLIATHFPNALENLKGARRVLDLNVNIFASPGPTV